MVYITNSDIAQRVGATAYTHLADDDGDGMADEGVVTAIRAAAQGEVDSYLAMRHRVPIDVEAYPELAGLLASITLDVAELRLRERRPPVAAEARTRAERAREWLAAVAAGRLTLPSLSPLPVAGVTATILGDERVLSADELAGF